MSDEQAARINDLEMRLASAEAELRHQLDMAARRGRLIEAYEARIAELGEMLGARENERPRLLKAKADLEKLQLIIEAEKACYPDGDVGEIGKLKEALDAEEFAKKLVTAALVEGTRPGAVEVMVPMIRARDQAFLGATVHSCPGCGRGQHAGGG